jgi:hypothetical protein
LYLCLTKHHTIKTCEGVEVYLYAFLTLAVGGGKWSVLRPCRITPGERATSTHWIGGWWAPEPVWTW